MQQQVQLIINDISDWQPYYPSQSLLTANEYLQTPLRAKVTFLTYVTISVISQPATMSACWQKRVDSACCHQLTPSMI